MKINIFNLKQRRDEWKEVERAMHQVWVGNTEGPILPLWCDYDFKKAFKNVKKEHSLKECQVAFNLV